MMGTTTTTTTTILLQSCLVAIAAYIAYRSSSFGTSSHHLQLSNDVIHAISASIGSAISITFLYPLETIRTRIQVDTAITYSSSFLLIIDIGRKEGIAKGLYKGWFSLVVALMVLNFVYFYSFHTVRRWVVDSLSHYMSSESVVDLITGYVAGCIAVLATGPLWLVNTRLKLQGVNIAGTENKASNKEQQYTGILHCLYQVSSKEGILTLWRGTFTSIILALNPAINLGVYLMLKRHHFIIDMGENNNKGSIEAFVNALISKFFATILTYPIQVVQTRHRAGSKHSATQRFGLKDMYRGVESKLMQTCFNSALMFVVYEHLVSAITTLTKAKVETSCEIDGTFI